MTTIRDCISTAGLLLGALILVPSAASGQVPERSVSLLVGGFSYDFGGDETFPMAALRLDHRISPHLVAELGTSYALARVDVVDHSQPDPTVREENSSITAATVGIQAELPLRHVRPYAGIAAGLFGRFDAGGGDRFLRTTTAFPVGVRIPASDRLTARAEVRLRFDEHQDGGSAVDTEMLLGIGWRY